MKKLFIAASVVLAAVGFWIYHTNYSSTVEPSGSHVDDGLVLTPPMGWNAWNIVGPNVSERVIMDIADAMADSGMKDAGYEFVVIDDGWMAKERDENGKPIPDPEKFPNGMKVVGDYVHSRGLKFGIYQSPDDTTCMGLPGAQDHEQALADDFAAWGVDYLKYDGCGAWGPEVIMKMREALNNTGRPIVLSTNAGFEGSWTPEISNLWRTTPDLGPNFNANDICDNRISMMAGVDYQDGLTWYARPGHWNDPDMMWIGGDKGPNWHCEMSPAECRTQLSLWSILAAPLMAGNDLRNMDQATIDILTAPEVIAVDQDPAAVQGMKIVDEGDMEIWARPLADGSWAAVFVNRSDNENSSDITLKYSTLGLKGEAEVRDLWLRQDEGLFKDSYTAKAIDPHDVKMIMLKGLEPMEPHDRYVSDFFDLKFIEHGRGIVSRDRAGAERAKNKRADREGFFFTFKMIQLRINDVAYDKGLAVYPPSRIAVPADGQYKRLTATIGLDDLDDQDGKVVFRVMGDNKILFESAVMDAATPSNYIEVDVSGVKQLELVVIDSGGGRHNLSDWANAYLHVE